MTQLRKIETEPGLVFDVLINGPADAPRVLLLHGFAESHHMRRAQLPALAAAGYRAIAPSQRGYSPGARPDPTDTANYHFDRLVADAIDVVAACDGAGRFHLIGHDWGGSIAWGLADRYPDRIASLTVLSRPHPNASTARSICRTASKRSARAPTNSFSNRTPGGWCWRMTRDICASGGATPAFRPRRPRNNLSARQ